MPTYLYIHIYTFKIQRHLISPTLNWFCTVHSSLFRDTGRMERCLCDRQQVQTTFTLHDRYSLYSTHVSSTNLSFVQYPWQQKLRLSTVCAENSSSGLPRSLDATALQHLHHYTMSAGTVPWPCLAFGVLRPGMPTRLMPHATCLEIQVLWLRTEISNICCGNPPGGLWDRL